MAQGKIILISDSLHGSIQISQLEKRIISTQVFNRLHNVLQNSTAYLTYPSNRTKRFEHALGAMHLCGRMFYSSIVNTEDVVRGKMLESAAEEVDGFMAEESFIRTVQWRFGKTPADFLKDYRNKIQIKDPLYSTNTPGAITPEQSFIYTLLYQAMRIAALLHDIGHPPFSHVAEFALKEVWEDINAISEKSRSDRQRHFLKVTDFYTKTTRAKLHEQIGNRIAEKVLQAVGTSPTDEEEIYREVFYLLASRTAMAILREETPLFKNLHRPIDGCIDCDRLDYVTRDLANSGFSYGPIEFDRLIGAMQLICEKGDFFFAFSSRTLGTIEDFFQRRWLLYKYVIYHHRVIKTDNLMKQAIITLAKDYLSSEEPDTPTQPQVLPLDISGLWRAIQEAYSENWYFDRVVQWDDSWLLAVLRKAFFEKYREVDGPIKYQLEELLSNTKYYHSLIKRTEDFVDIDRSVAAHFETDWEALKSIEILQGYVDSLHKQADAIQGANGAEIGLDSFFTTNLKVFYEMLTNDSVSFGSKIRESVNNVVKSGKYNIVDCFATLVRLDTGFGKPTRISVKDRVVTIGQASAIQKEIEQKQALFPTFFIYFMAQGNIDSAAFMADIGKEAGKQLSNLIREQLLNLTSETYNI